MADMNRSCYTQDKNTSQSNQEFIPFSSPPQARFSPSNYSSPVKNNNYRRKHWNRSSGSNFNQSGNNSVNRYSGPSNRTFNNSRNNSWTQKFQNNSQGKNDITSFLHPSFTEDPWKKLEEDLKRKKSEVAC